MVLSYNNFIILINFSNLLKHKFPYPTNNYSVFLEKGNNFKVIAD